MIIEGEVVYVSEPQEQNGKGNRTYHIIEVIYKPSDGGPAKTQKLVSFNNPKVFDDIQTFDNGDKIWINTIKNEETGYWGWQEVSKEPIEGAPAPAQRRASGGAKAADKQAGGKVVGNNYETPQERGRKQIYIVRQSSVDRAMATKGDLDPFKKADMKKILDTAEQIEQWIFRGYKVNDDDTISRAE